MDNIHFPDTDRLKIDHLLLNRIKAIIRRKVDLINWDQDTYEARYKQICDVLGMSLSGEES